MSQTLITDPARHREEGTIIWQQLGRARAMIGATLPGFHYNDRAETTLTFKIGRNPKKVTHIRITLVRHGIDADTYRMEFLRCAKFDCKTLSEAGLVYADFLHATIEAHTGLRTSL